jgi:creatinine amidohydrolase
VEYGVNARTRTPYPGNASLRRKTLHRFMNDLVGSWEESGVRQFVILTAHGDDPHQEALSTLRTKQASIRTVDVFTARLDGEDAELPIHGGALDTSLVMFVDRDLVRLDDAQDYLPSPRRLRAWYRSVQPEGPGSVGHPSRASVEAGARLYHLIYERVATRVFGRAPRPTPTARP